jgi:hypothetical protein
VSARLGKNQLRLLRTLCAGMSVIVPDKLTRSLCDRGLMREAVPGAFVGVTANGLRALADAADRGEVILGHDTTDLPNPQDERGRE